MTIVTLKTGQHPVNAYIENAVEAHGAIHVLALVLRATLSKRRIRRARPPDVDSLDPRLRKDIGLPVEPDFPDWRHLIL